MPHPGDQHRDTHATANPFVAAQAHMTEYTAQEIATLQSRLDKQLGPEYISTRPGNGGGKVHYLAAEKVINLANEVFGFNGWSSGIQNVQIDFVDENEHGRINLGLSTIVRVTLKDGTYHEDIGYGHCENTKGKAAAFEKAKKEAATDALKRALRNFGNVLGNCLYDKDYLQKVTKVKVAPSKWDAENLHRHHDYAPVKKEATSNETTQAKSGSGASRNASLQSLHSNGSAEFEDDFGGNLFDETDFSNPDGLRLDEGNMNNIQLSAQPGEGKHSGQRQPPRTASMPQMRVGNVQPPQTVPNVQPPARIAAPQTPAHPQKQQIPAGAVIQQNADGVRSNMTSSTGWLSSTDLNQQVATANSVNNNQDPLLPQDVTQGIPGGFMTGRGVDLLSKPSDSRPPPAALAFNPHAESPSIRRTHGINPGKSTHVTRQQISGTNGQAPSNSYAPPIGKPGPAASVSNAGQRPPGTNFVNPAADMNRKIGMPQSGPNRNFQNGSAYRPPSAVKRPAMSDVTNIHQADGTSDVKKPRIESALAQGEDAATRDTTVTM